MFKRKQIVLAGAALAAMPLVSHAAVTVNYQFDPNDYIYSADGTFDDAVPVVATGTALNPIITVPFSATGQIAIGLDAEVLGDTNPASGAGYDTVVSHTNKQAPLLGITSWQVGLTDSAQTKAFVTSSGGTATAAVDNPPFAANQASGNTNGSGGITASTGIAGALNLAGNHASTATQIAATDYGAGAYAELFNGLDITTAAAGTAVFTLTDLDAALQYAHNTSIGSSTVAPTYVDQTFIAGTDSLGTLPTLTINMTSGATTGSSGHAIISLTASPTTPTGYGSNVGTVTVTGSAGSYKPSTGDPTTGLTGTTTDYVEGKTFSPGSDKEIYALEVTNGSSPATDISTIVSDINNGVATSIPASSGVVASSTLPTGAVFPGGPYNLYLTFSSPPSGDNFMGWDFSNTGNQSTSGIATGDFVSAVALVPEPASTAFVLVGASGALLGRRRRNKALQGA